MRTPDTAIVNALDANQTVLFEAKAHYDGNNYYPAYVEITAEGTTAAGGVGLRLKTEIRNP
jgi:hypothetical protein